MKVIRQSCLATEARGSAKHLSGNENYPLGNEGELVLTSCDVSSLVVNRLCDQASGQSATATCFYFDIAARKEQSVTSILGSLLKQVVGGMRGISEEISQAFQQQKRVIGGRGPQLQDIVKALQTITSH